jgi:4-hydroxy-tetrahydrodipicolinate synthase
VSPEIIAMTALRPGLVHAPVTPFTADHAIDYERYGRLLDFHVGNGADSLALPMHTAESVSLTDDERRSLIAFAVAHLDGRVPVLAHVSDSGTAIAAAVAASAERTGAAAVIASTPYYWTPPPAMVVEHFAQIAGAVTIPLYVHNAPADMAGAKVSADMMLALAERARNFAGLVDSGLDWQFMIELVSRAKPIRPDFALISGTEHMVSAGAIGADGMVSTLAGVAPRLVRSLYDLCRAESYVAARAPQSEVAALRQALKAGGIASLKAALGAMERPVGAPRPPLEPLGAAPHDALAAALAAIPALRDEPRGFAG